MAERGGSREGSTRRQSFRQSLYDADLPPEYLEALEQKRKQLDESIHKYIAAKERDYKQFERELKQKYSLTTERDREGSGKTRRTSSESTQDPAGSPRLLGQHQNVIDTLFAAGLKRENIGQSVAVAMVEEDGLPPTIETKSAAGLIDRRASVDRDKEFVGVFTPAYLPALGKTQESPERTFSAPPASSSSKGQSRDEHAVQRANSDSMAEAKHKRPAHLQLVHRTSSSGSSVDGKLTSALKSPTQQNDRPKRKRVSLAINDTIVAPSDNVPVSMSSHNSTPSHSRTRSPVKNERDAKGNKATSSLRDMQRPPATPSTSSDRSEPILNGKAVKPESKVEPFVPPPTPPTSVKQKVDAVPPLVPSIPAPAKPPVKIDPDGDLFDLEDEDDPPLAHSEAGESEDEMTGRVEREGVQQPREDLYDDNAGIIPDELDDHADHIEFGPGSAVASQQPTDPGFRRPSVSSDPVYVGTDYERAEHSAATNDIYGSNYSRPNKGSFTAGSLGESFMARNAEQLMKNRDTQKSTQIYTTVTSTLPLI